MSFTRVAAATDVVNAHPLAVVADGVDIVLVRQGDSVYALRDECSHGAIPLSEGEVDGSSIECWLHGSRFDLATGAVLNLPATEPVATYPVQIDGDEILVDVEHPSIEEN